MFISSFETLPVTLRCLCMQSANRMLEYILVGESVLKELEIPHDFLLYQF